MTEATGKQPPNAPMTIERLRSLLDAYGTTPERWPEAERARAAKDRA